MDNAYQEYNNTLKEEPPPSYEIYQQKCPFVQKNQIVTPTNNLNNMAVNPNNINQLNYPPIPNNLVNNNFSSTPPGIGSQSNVSSISGIMVGANKNMAILSNGQIVSEGDNLPQGCIVSINKEGIIFDSGTKMVYK